VNKLENMWKLIHILIKYGDLASDYYRKERIALARERRWSVPRYDENSANSATRFKYSKYVFRLGYYRINNEVTMNFQFNGKLKCIFNFKLMFKRGDDGKFELTRFFEESSYPTYTISELHVDFQTNDYLTWVYNKLCIAFDIDSDVKFDKLMSVIDEKMLGLI